MHLEDTQGYRSFGLSVFGIGEDEVGLEKITIKGRKNWVTANQKSETI